MNTRSATTRVLLVEGDDDCRVLPWLVESSGIEWKTGETPIVKIQPRDGVEGVLAPGEIETQLKASRLTALGVIVDADGDTDERWRRIRARVADTYPTVPAAIPTDGIVLTEPGQPNFGAWIMPDNSSCGMLESFLLLLRPEENVALLELSSRVVSDARSAGAPFLDAHVDKARIHSWLAWQNPPGRQMHNAIQQRMLSAKTPLYWRFISWFCRLYGLSCPSAAVT